MDDTSFYAENVVSFSFGREEPLLMTLKKETLAISCLPIYHWYPTYNYVDQNHLRTTSLVLVSETTAYTQIFSSHSYYCT